MLSADLCAKPWIIQELDSADPLRLRVELELAEAHKRACEVLGISKRRCKGCGVSLDLRTPSCDNCISRHCMRKLMEKRRANAN